MHHPSVLVGMLCHLSSSIDTLVDEGLMIETERRVVMCGLLRWLFYIWR